MDCPVINAGDGTGEHPTQALLDAATIRRHFGRVEGLRVAVCGDLAHSRVARSNGKLLSRLGADVRFAGPPPLLPPDFEGSGSIDEAVEGADVVMMLRIQRERLDEDLNDAPGEYLARYGLTAERLAKAAPDAVVMHPGPNHAWKTQVRKAPESLRAQAKSTETLTRLVYPGCECIDLLRLDISKEPQC